MKRDEYAGERKDKAKTRKGKEVVNRFGLKPLPPLNPPDESEIIDIEEPNRVNIILTSYEEKGIKRGMEKGMKIGIEKGIEKEKLEVAKNLLKDRVDIHLISRATKLPLSKIRSLQKQKV